MNRILGIELGPDEDRSVYQRAELIEHILADLSSAQRLARPRSM